MGGKCLVEYLCSKGRFGPDKSGIENRYTEVYSFLRKKKLREYLGNLQVACPKCSTILVIRNSAKKRPAFKEEGRQSNLVVLSTEQAI